MQNVTNIKKLLVFYIPVVFTALAISSCGVQKVTSTVEIPLMKKTASFKKLHLLDLAVIPFKSSENKSQNNNNSPISSTAQNAEGLFLANQLTSTIQGTSAWGAVRSIPDRKTIVDVYIEGKIINSDGEKLTLEISVSDVANRSWYTKTYTQTVGYYAYKKDMEIYRDPFQNLFNNIANDLLEYNQKLSSGEIKKLSTISDLKFAEDFSPESFEGHIEKTVLGELKILRLPAKNDPILMKISDLRERDHLFIDTMQGYYDNFSRRMNKPYQSWRQATHEEISSARELKRQSVARTVGGIAAVIGGIMASGSTSGSAQSAGAVAIGTGALLVKSGMEKRSELKIHEDVLAELEQSLESEIEPRIIELENDRVVLTGNVTEHYNQWKSYLKQRYEAEHSGT
jgi:hypothetical protein